MAELRDWLDLFGVEKGRRVMSVLNQKMVCVKCVWYGYGRDRLVAQNPFEPKEKLFGCPGCKGADCLRIACDEDDCWERATCGTATATGYRYTCCTHKPEAGGE